MFEFLLVVALTWSPDCVAIGELYRAAAELRDRGRPLREVLRMTADSRIRRTMIHVYERPDMTPQDWRWFAIGVCVGEEKSYT